MSPFSWVAAPPSHHFLLLLLLYLSLMHLDFSIRQNSKATSTPPWTCLTSILCGLPSVWAVLSPYYGHPEVTSRLLPLNAKSVITLCHCSPLIVAVLFCLGFSEYNSHQGHWGHWMGSAQSELILGLYKYIYSPLVPALSWSGSHLPQISFLVWQDCNPICAVVAQPPTSPGLTCCTFWDAFLSPQL